MLSGGDGDDLLVGREGKDTIDGGVGSDTALYREKADLVVVTLDAANPVTVKVGGVDEDSIVNVENIEGGSAADTLTGDGLNNSFLGGGGKDVLDGGAGSDTALYTDKLLSVTVTLDGGNPATVKVGGVSEDTLTRIENVTGGSGDDVLVGDVLDNVLAGGDGADRLQGMAGKDALDGGDGIDTAVFSDASQAVVLTLNSNFNATATIGGVADDIVRNIENILGGSGDDVLTGDFRANLLEGAGGDDRLAGGGGKDTLDGGTGVDTAVYSEKTVSVAVTLNGATNATVTVGGTAEDTLRNIENVIGGSGDDTLTGDGLANLLEGGTGNDRLSGAGGADILDGGAGIDLAVYTEKLVTVVAVLDGANDSKVFVGGKFEDTIRNIEGLVGGAADDELTGDGLANTLEGGGGNDILSGGDGDDILSGGAGQDVLDGGDGSDTASFSDKILAVTVALANGAPVVAKVGGVAEDTLINIENIIGGTGNDVLTGDALANRFTGGGGKDVIDGKSGADTADYGDKLQAVIVTLNGSADSVVTVGGLAEDTLRNIENLVGGSGADTLNGDDRANRLEGGLGDDLLRGGGGNDVLDGGAGNDTVVYSEKLQSLALTLGGADDAIAYVGGLAEDVVRNVENVTGGAGDDFLTGDGLANVLIGGLGNDVLMGGAGKDTLDGGDGSDTAVYSDRSFGISVTLNGAQDAVVTVGLLAEDTLRNVENIVGTSQADTITGDTLDNIVRGGGGKDTLDGAGGLDTVDYSDKTQAVEVTLNGATYTVALVGGAIEDTIRFFENAIGGTGDDSLTGDAGANRLEGGDGNDTLTGGGGGDILIGGTGDDHFILGAGTALIDDGDGADVVTGFVAGAGAKLDLSRLSTVTSIDGLLALGAQDGADAVFDFGGGDTLRLQNVALASLGAGDFILANATTLSIAALDATKPEGNAGVTALTFEITRDGDISVASKATWTVIGTGISPAESADFQGGVLPSGAVDFAAGETAKTITVNVAADDVAEADNGFTVSLSAATGAAVATGHATGTILDDDDEAPCFTAGTRILTARGEVPVEALKIGDMVAVLRGASQRPILWIGRRHVRLHGHPRPWDVQPVRIRAHAFGPGRPHTDLRLSPDHAVFAEGVLVPVRYLVNGVTIVQEKVAEVTYFHIELAAADGTAAHDVLLAEGLPTESYLDTGNRGALENGGPVVALHPDFARATWVAGGCAPLVIAGPELADLRTILLAEATTLGHDVTTDPNLRLLVDGVVIRPSRGGDTYHFNVPPRSREVRLLSHTTVPAWIDADGEDTRCLGVAVAGMLIEGCPVLLDDERLRTGWHQPEDDWRWTNGFARLPPMGGALKVTVVPLQTYWVPAHEARRHPGVAA